MFSALDHQMMARALRLAELGLYTTTPNPRVGCVIVKDGQIVGEGAHLKAGEPHAEVHALRQAGDLARGADAYVTLEPCSHHGRTPPCADALIKAGVKRVVAAMQDPNPQVAGSGLQRLQAQGIAVQSGLLEAQARSLNAGFISRMTRRRPFVRSKIAASLDGATALQNGISQWITGPEARKDVQHWRAQSCAMLTGIGTVLADDPQLSVRNESGELQGRQPLRVIVDSHLQISPRARILQGGNALIVYGSASADRIAALCQPGVELMQLPDHQSRVSLDSLLELLASRGINDVMVEAGATLNGALLHQGLIDQLILYYAPKLLGADARGMFGLPMLQNMAARIDLDITDMRQFGRDIRLLAIPHPPQP